MPSKWSLNSRSNNTVEFIEKKLTFQDIEKISEVTEEVRMVGCKSTEWEEIGLLLAHKPNLRTLYLDKCNSGNQLCNCITDSKSLRSLTMKNCSVSEEGVEKLCFLHELTYLNLSNNDLITESSSMVLVLMELRKLKELKLELPFVHEICIDGFNIGDTGAELLARNLDNLKVLSAKYNNIGQAGALAIAQHIKDLDKLDIGYNKITDMGALALVKGHSQLKEFVLTGNDLSLPAK